MTKSESDEIDAAIMAILVMGGSCLRSYIGYRLRVSGIAGKKFPLVNDAAIYRRLRRLRAGGHVELSKHFVNYWQIKASKREQQ